MQSALLIFSVLAFIFTTWLGLYLLRRDARDPRLRWTGIGLILYAFVVGVLIVQAGRVPDVQDLWPPHFWWLLSLPAVAWTGAAVHLLPETSLRTHLQRFWLYGQIPLIFLLAPLFIVVGATADTSAAGWLLLVLALIVLTPLFMLILAIGLTGQQARSRGSWILLVVASLFFALSLGALLLPFLSLDPAWLLLGMGVDLLILGLVISGMDAFDQGERLVPDLLLSLDGVLLYCLIFGGIVVVAMVIETGATSTMLGLLLLILLAAIVLFLFASPIQAGLDRAVLGDRSVVGAERSELRTEVDDLPRYRIAAGGDIEQILDDDVAFARLTRRALSQMNDLNKLSKSPLIELSTLEAKVLAAGEEVSTTTRAQALSAVLTEAIAAMQPSDDADFGTTGQWRFYNALYYPYVVGLRPYSRQVNQSGLDATTLQALSWFREQVPERTLYNWQRNGAEWVAQYLRDLVRETLPDQRICCMTR